MNFDLCTASIYLEILTDKKINWAGFWCGVENATSYQYKKSNHLLWINNNYNKNNREREFSANSFVYIFQVFTKSWYVRIHVESAEPDAGTGASKIRLRQHVHKFHNIDVFS